MILNSPSSSMVVVRAAVALPQRLGLPALLLLACEEAHPLDCRAQRSSDRRQQAIVVFIEGRGFLALRVEHPDDLLVHPDWNAKFRADARRGLDVRGRLRNVIHAGREFRWQPRAR